MLQACSADLENIYRGALRVDDEGKDVIVSGSFATGSVRARHLDIHNRPSLQMHAKTVSVYRIVFC